jgi:hypothetical protein
MSTHLLLAASDNDKGWVALLRDGSRWNVYMNARTSLESSVGC